MEIINYKDAVKRGLKFYFTGKSCKNGHIAKRIIDQRICYECIKENRDVLNKRAKLWRINNPEKSKAISSKWAKNNPKNCVKRVAKRNAAKLQRIPPWIDLTQKAEIDSIYEYCSALRACGLNYHVDHIVPIQGKTVSGLHVPWNLQVIPAKENIIKSNNF